MEVLPWHSPSKTGLSNFMIDQIGKNLGVTIHTESMPWKRCLALVQLGKMDGAIAASFTPQRIEIGAYPLLASQEPDRSRRMSTESYSLFVRKNDANDIYWDGKTLLSNNLPIAAQAGYSVIEHLENQGIRVDDSDKKPDQLLRKVVLKSVSAAVLIRQEGERLLLDPRFSGEIIRLDPPILSSDAYLLLSHSFVQQNPKLAKRIWREITKVRQSAAYQKRMLTIRTDANR